MSDLETREADAAEPEAPLKVITVRMPETRHAMLTKLAHARETSANKLCNGLIQDAIDAHHAFIAAGTCTAHNAPGPPVE